MRSFGVAAILLLLAAVAPPPSLRTEYEPLWALGALLLLAVTAQRSLARARLPALTGWILSALLLGPSALAAIDPSRVPLLALAGTVAGVWAGLVVGLGVSWPSERRNWRLPVIVAASTVATFAALAAVIGLVSDLPWRVVLVFAAIGSFWGPVVSDFWRSREIQVIGLFGVAVAFLILGVVVVVGAGSSWIAAEGRIWVAHIALSGAGGAATAEALWRLRILQRRDSALLALAAMTLLGAFAAVHVGLPSLPIGLGAGLVLAGREGSGRQLGHLLVPVRSIAILLFAAVLVASTDAVTLLTPSVPWLYEIVLAQLVILVIARGIGPALWYPLPSSGEFSRRTGWLLLPKGLIAGELALGGGGRLAQILSPPYADLLRRVVLADLFLYGVVFAAFAALVPPRSEDEDGADPEPVPE